MAEELKVDEELEGLKSEPQRSSSDPLTMNRRTESLFEKARSKARSRSTLDDPEKTLEAGIRELRGAIDAIGSVQGSIEKQCSQSRAKAVESHQKAQLALAEHDMNAVFQHSVDKAVHIKVVQALKSQIDITVDKVRSLRRSLTNLEALKTKFENQAKFVNLQATNPGVDPSVESLKEQLGLTRDVDAELADLSKQLDSL
ncbi:hypothetical protein H6F90_29755 [Trichocoleus sp. FACHB-591]|uniref:hypothetical protein n=1 Tax=Trichocoleus sp. FACHB-591 TaxID=2692872 RepID=UPI001685E773|nr:hypothetical protein [Trichocoleus sp. FACHB-591]MBD2099252.1 hypothetical protein [Trichocoleus sp. FACHB-591]